MIADLTAEHSASEKRMELEREKQFFLAQEIGAADTTLTNIKQVLGE